MRARTRTPSVLGALALAIGVGSTLPAALHAQGQEDPPPPPPTVQDSTQLVFEREVFTYPSYQRANPFQPLVSAAGGGPWFEEMRLMSIIHSTGAPSQSMALLAAGGDPSAADGANIATRRMRVGDVWGNTRIVEIQRRNIVVEVTEFGLAERHVLALPTPGAGGL